MFLAHTRGTVTIHADPKAFVRAFVRRIETGLLRGTHAQRTRYSVTHQDADGLGFHADTWLTAFNVGLNGVELAVSSDGQVRFTIEYRRWAASVLIFSAALGLIVAVFFLTYDIRSYIERNAASRVWGLSTDQNVAIAWAMVVFWGFVFPWILIPLHKGPLRRLMTHLIAEVDSEAMTAEPRTVFR